MNFDTVKGECFISDWTLGSSNLRPISRFTSAKIKAKIESQLFHCSLTRLCPKLTENCVRGIHSDLIFCSITDQSFGFHEGNVARCCSVSLVVRSDFHLSMLINSDTGVRGTEIDSNRWFFWHILGRFETTEQHKKTKMYFLLVCSEYSLLAGFCI